MIETTTYNSVFPREILNKYLFYEMRSAATLLKTVCPNEYRDIVDVLKNFKLTASMLLTKGGNRGIVPITIDTKFAEKGWIEARVDLEQYTYVFKGHNTSKSAEEHPEKYKDNLESRIYQKGYAVDNFKGRVALDVEWNPKDGNLDRDFAAYRAWYDEGVIDVAVLITRVQNDTKELTNKIWQDYITSHPKYKDNEQIVTFGTTTTANFEKAIQRIKRGDLGGCPILAIGIGKKTYDNKPWDGNMLKWDKTKSRAIPKFYFTKNKT